MCIFHNIKLNSILYFNLIIFFGKKVNITIIFGVKFQNHCQCPHITSRTTLVHSPVTTILRWNCSTKKKDKTLLFLHALQYRWMQKRQINFFRSNRLDFLN